DQLGLLGTSTQLQIQLVGLAAQDAPAEAGGFVELMVIGTEAVLVPVQRTEGIPGGAEVVLRFETTPISLGRGLRRRIAIRGTAGGNDRGTEDVMPALLVIAALAAEVGRRAVR